MTILCSQGCASRGRCCSCPCIWVAYGCSGFVDFMTSRNRMQNPKSWVCLGSGYAQIPGTPGTRVYVRPGIPLRVSLCRMLLSKHPLRCQQAYHGGHVWEPRRILCNAMAPLLFRETHVHLDSCWGAEIGGSWFSPVKKVDNKIGHQWFRSTRAAVKNSPHSPIAVVPAPPNQS